jgi:hypothetical protein
MDKNIADGPAGENKGDLPGRHCFQYLIIDKLGVKSPVLFFALPEIIKLLEKLVGCISSFSIYHAKPSDRLTNILPVHPVPHGTFTKQNLSFCVALEIKPRGLFLTPGCGSQVSGPLSSRSKSGSLSYCS